ncbi:hypothetical protein Hanom_Chr14g01262111 [Helianthus anomalus]
MEEGEIRKPEDEGGTETPVSEDGSPAMGKKGREDGGTGVECEETSPLEELHGGKVSAVNDKRDI